MSSCYDCGAPVAPEDRFCGNCGLALQPAGRPGAEGGGASAPSAELLSDSAEPGVTTGPTDAQESAPQPAQEPADDLQPTLIEASHGGSAAAAARAPEPSEPEAPPAGESAGLSSASLPPPDETEVTADTSED